ncbi:MAG: AsmA family protein [Betaproteobacteria bacterium]
MKILAGAAAVVVVLLLGVVVAVSTVDVNTLIAPVRDRVKAMTGRDLTVRGGARVALSLQPRLVLGDVSLSNAPWASAKDMVTAQRVELQVALLPLLSRRFELIELMLVDPVIALETDAQGQGNWTSATAPGTLPGAASAPPVPAIFAAGNVSISNGSLTYRDGASGSVTRVAIDRLFVRARDPATPIVAEFRGRIGDVPVTLEGTLGSADALLAQRWPYPVSLQGEVAGQKASISTKLKAEGGRYSLNDLALKFGADALTGTFAVVTGGARPRLEFDLTGPALALNVLPVPLPVAAPKAAAPAAKAAPHYMIPDTPVDFAPLHLVDARGRLAVGRLRLPDGREFESLRVEFTLDNGKLDLSSFSLTLMGGTMSGALTIDAGTAGTESLAVRMEGKGLALDAILAAAGYPRQVRGGKTDVNATLAMRGASPRAWAASATGIVGAVVGPATLVNTKVGSSSTFDKLGEALNPFRTMDASTELKCAVVRLQLANGVAKVDRGIAMETAKLGVGASGTLDFRNETLDFAFQPKIRKDIPLEIASLADFVRVSGPFASPQIRIDPVGSAKALATIGAAVGTSGVSVLGQALFAWAEGKGAGPCAIALGAAAPSAAALGTAAKAEGDQAPIPLASEIGKAIGKLLGK